jgi:hypothetical protein
LPFIAGYKPRGISQLLLRKVVQQHVLDHADELKGLIDALEEVKSPSEQSFMARLVEPPTVLEIVHLETGGDQPASLTMGTVIAISACSTAV